MSSNIKDYLFETLKIVVLAFVLAMVLRSWVVEGRVIPTGSMLPTIQLQDRVMVNKFIYYFSEPERGDIVVFAPPAELNPPATDDYIKRVVGLPGETVEIKDHSVYINGKVLEEPYLLEPVNYNWGPVRIPDDCVLVLGDNRNNSSDTHMWRDQYNHQIFLKKDRIKGEAFIIYWPLNDFGFMKGDPVLK